MKLLNFTTNFTNFGSGRDGAGDQVAAAATTPVDVDIIDELEALGAVGGSPTIVAHATNNNNRDHQRQQQDLLSGDQLIKAFEPQCDQLCVSSGNWI